MSQIELLDGDTWRPFVESPAAVLMLGKSDCEACHAWTEELEEFLAADEQWGHVRFGKLELDRPGLTDFKRENPWLSGIKDLPYNLIYCKGERKKEFLGSGVERLVNRLRRVLETPA